MKKIEKYDDIYFTPLLLTAGNFKRSADDRSCLICKNKEETFS